MIGLIGGIGSGKSAVAKWLASRRNVLSIDADAIGHDVLHRESVKNELKWALGEGIFRDDGEVNRREIGRLVFGPSNEQRLARQRLEQIVHPRIHRKISETISGDKASKTHEAILLDAAILLEAGWNDVCTVVVFIETCLKTRRERVRQDRGWSHEELSRRESSQLDLPRKISQADFVVKNDSTIEHAGRQLEKIFNRLIADTV